MGLLLCLQLYPQLKGPKNGFSSLVFVRLWTDAMLVQCSNAGYVQA